MQKKREDFLKSREEAIIAKKNADKQLDEINSKLTALENEKEAKILEAKKHFDIQAKTIVERAESMVGEMEIQTNRLIEAEVRRASQKLRTIIVDEVGALARKRIEANFDEKSAEKFNQKQLTSLQNLS